MGGAVDTGVTLPEALGGYTAATTHISSRTADRTDSKMAAIDDASAAETSDPVPTPSMARVDGSPEVLVAEDIAERENGNIQQNQTEWS